MAKETATSKKIISNKLDLLSPKHCFLSTFLLRGNLLIFIIFKHILEKKNPKTFWKPYLDMLPSDFFCFPIFFNEEDLSWLEGSPFLSKFLIKNINIQKKLKIK